MQVVVNYKVNSFERVLVWFRGDVTGGDFCFWTSLNPVVLVDH